MKTISHGPKRQLNSAKGRSGEGKMRQVFYKSARWQELRKKHLKAMPYCEKCLEETGFWNSRNVIVDHIYGHDDPGWLQRFWDPACLQTLCKDHHNQKTAQERPDSGFNTPVRRRMSASKRKKIREKLSEAT